VQLLKEWHANIKDTTTKPTAGKLAQAGKRDTPATVHMCSTSKLQLLEILQQFEKS
jgi:phosphatidate phosphatase APP1